jgi:hypothetical protein
MAFSFAVLFCFDRRDSSELPRAKVAMASKYARMTVKRKTPGGTPRRAIYFPPELSI